MSKWIDADALRAVIARWGEHEEHYMEAELNIFRCVIEEIDNAPSIDIVGCLECKHRFDCFSEVAMTNKHQTTTLYQGISFCSYGERSE